MTYKAPTLLVLLIVKKKEEQGRGQGRLGRGNEGRRAEQQIPHEDVSTEYHSVQRGAQTHPV